MVQIVSIATSLAFAGVIFIVLGLIFFGGSDSGQGQVIKDAQKRVKQQPTNPAAWDELASAYATANPAEAVKAAKRAAELAPNDLSRAETLASLQQQAGDAAGAVATLQAYTAANPRDAQAFLRLGQVAEDAGRTPLARLSYQTFLRLAPGDRNAAAVRAAIQRLTPAGTTTR